MNTRKMTHSRAAVSVLSFCTITLASGQVGAEANRVTFPSTLDQLVHYTTVKRGNVTEHILTSQQAIDAVKQGQPVPSGTHFVLVDYRDSKVFRYFVMEKRDGWGADYEPARRTEDWQFQSFRPDKTVNLGENTARCQSCHQGQKDSQHLYTFADIKRSK